MEQLVKGFTTKIVHSDRQDTIEHGSLHKPVHANVAYGYEDARKEIREEKHAISPQTEDKD